jgi:hypothetical protein
MTDEKSNARVVADAMVEQYVEALRWSAEATEYEKQLVVGNLRGFSILVEQALSAMQAAHEEARREWGAAGLGKEHDPLWRVRGGSMTELISEMGRGIDLQHLGAGTGEPDVLISRQRLWVVETLATIAGVYLRNLVNPNVGEAQRADLAADYARMWLTELQAAVLRYERGTEDVRE